MKKILVILCLFLSGCGTIAIRDLGGSIKEIKLTGFTAPPAALEVRTMMDVSAYKECPNGFKLLNRQYTRPPRILIWKIKCSQSRKQIK